MLFNQSATQITGQLEVLDAALLHVVSGGSAASMPPPPPPLAAPTDTDKLIPFPDKT